MTKRSSIDSDVEFSGKIYGQTFKQFQLENLKKSGKVFPASSLEDRKKEAEEEAKEFARAVEDEVRYRVRASKPVAPVGKTLSDVESIYTRVPFED